MKRHTLHKIPDRNAPRSFGMKRTSLAHHHATGIKFDDQVRKIEYEVALLLLAEMGN